MHQLRPQTGLLDLLHNPVPIGRGLQRYRGAGLATGQHPPDRPRRVLQTILPNSTRRHLLVLDPGVVLVTVKRDIFFHARLLSSSKNPFHRQPTLTAGVALSYFHPDPAEREKNLLVRQINHLRDSSSVAAATFSEMAC